MCSSDLSGLLCHFFWHNSGYNLVKWHKGFNNIEKVITNPYSVKGPFNGIRGLFKCEYFEIIVNMLPMEIFLKGEKDENNQLHENCRKIR